MLPELGQLVDWKVWAWDWAVDFFPWTWAIPGAVALSARGVRVWREELSGFRQVSGVVPPSLVFVIHCMSCMLEGVSDPWVLIGPIEGWSPTRPGRLLGGAPPTVYASSLVDIPEWSCGDCSLWGCRGHPPWLAFSLDHFFGAPTEDTLLDLWFCYLCYLLMVFECVLQSWTGVISTA